jgi:AbrB family looped-hinge helix DNA binding protein
MAGWESLGEHFLGSVTVGERGQVVIPAEARDKSGIESGDKLLAFMHPSGGGVFFVKLEAMSELIEQARDLVQTANKEAAEEAPSNGNR